MISAKIKVLRDDKRTQARIRRELDALANTYTVVGFPGDIPPHSGTENATSQKTGKKLKKRVAKTSGTGAGITMAELAAVHEFGSPARGIPSRPFMRTTADDPQNKKRAGKLAEAVLSKVYGGTLSGVSGVRQIGEWYIGQLKRSMTRGPWVPNSAETERRKGSSRPLIDSGQLRNSITQRIRHGSD